MATAEHSPPGAPKSAHVDVTVDVNLRGGGCRPLEWTETPFCCWCCKGGGP